LDGVVGSGDNDDVGFRDWDADVRGVEEQVDGSVYSGDVLGVAVFDCERVVGAYEDGFALAEVGEG